VLQSTEMASTKQSEELFKRQVLEQLKELKEKLDNLIEANASAPVITKAGSAKKSKSPKTVKSEDDLIVKDYYVTKHEKEHRKEFADKIDAEGKPTIAYHRKVADKFAEFIKENPDFTQEALDNHTEAYRQKQLDKKAAAKAKVAEKNGKATTTSKASTSKKTTVTKEASSDTEYESASNTSSKEEKATKPKAKPAKKAAQPKVKTEPILTSDAESVASNSDVATTTSKGKGKAPLKKQVIQDSSDSE